MSFRMPCHMPFRKLIPPFTLTALLVNVGRLCYDGNHHHSWLDILWKWLPSGGHLVFRKCTSFLFCVSLSGMMKSWPVKIQEKGTPDQERGRSQHLGPVKIVKPNRPHGNSIYPTDVSVWTALKVRTRTVTISFPWRIIPGNGTGTAIPFFIVCETS